MTLLLLLELRLFSSFNYKVAGVGRKVIHKALQITV